MKPAELFEFISDSEPIVARDSRKNRPYFPINAEYFNQLYSTLLPLVMESERILDVGCCMGASILFFRRAGWKGEYVGIELQEGFLNAAKEISPNETFVCADAIEYLNSCNKFDLVICLGVAHTFIEPFSLFRAVANASTRYIVIDAKEIHADINGNKLERNGTYALISSMSASPMPGVGEFEDTRGLGCSITKEYVELFINSIGLTKVEIDTSVLKSGVYYPTPYRVLQVFTRENASPNMNILQEKLK